MSEEDHLETIKAATRHLEVISAQIENVCVIQCNLVAALAGVATIVEDIDAGVALNPAQRDLLVGIRDLAEAVRAGAMAH